MIRNFIEKIFDNKQIIGVTRGTITVIDKENRIILFHVGKIVGHRSDSSKEILRYNIMLGEVIIGSGYIDITPLEYEYFLEKCRDLQEEQTLKIFRNDN